MKPNTRTLRRSIKLIILSLSNHEKKKESEDTIFKRKNKRNETTTDIKRIIGEY